MTEISQEMHDQAVDILNTLGVAEEEIKELDGAELVNAAVVAAHDASHEDNLDVEINRLSVVGSPPEEQLQNQFEMAGMSPQEQESFKQNLSQDGQAYHQDMVLSDDGHVLATLENGNVTYGSVSASPEMLDQAQQIAIEAAAHGFDMADPSSMPQAMIGDPREAVKNIVTEKVIYQDNNSRLYADTLEVDSESKHDAQQPQNDGPGMNLGM